MKFSANKIYYNFSHEDSYIDFRGTLSIKYGDLKNKCIYIKFEKINLKP